MKNSAFVITVMVWTLMGCNPVPQKEALDQLVTLGLKNHAGVEFCLGNELTDENFKLISDLLSDANYDCMKVFTKDVAGEDDSVLVLMRKKLDEVEYLYYDFAEAQRDLEVWDREGDKRENIEERLYLRSIHF